MTRRGAENRDAPIFEFSLEPERIRVLLGGNTTDLTQYGWSTDTFIYRDDGLIISTGGKNIGIFS